MSWSLRRTGRQLLSVVVSPYPSSRYSRALLSKFKDYRRLILTLLTLQPFDFLAARFYLSLIRFNLLWLLVVGVLLPLQRVADQGTGADPKAPANSCAYTRMTYRRAN